MKMKNLCISQQYGFLTVALNLTNTILREKTEKSIYCTVGFCLCCVTVGQQ